MWMPGPQPHSPNWEKKKKSLKPGVAFSKAPRSPLTYDQNRLTELHKVLIRFYSFKNMLIIQILLSV